ncbi:MAG: TetR/AcrR family transcriptional regulator [Clostridia bacterium]|nr:TetR/AcrR family transcriptional regulator [Clostridia bacterium]
MDKLDKRELILTEAEKLFCQRGYYGLGLSELLKQCGIPKGSFYYYFPDGKLQLIQEVLWHSYRRMEAGITEGILVETSALSCFERMADHLAQSVCERDYFPSMLMSMIAIESVYLDERVHQTCKTIYSEWQQLYARYLIRFGVSKEESVSKAQAIFALIHGSMISSWIKQDPQDLLLAKSSLQHIIGNR